MTVNIEYETQKKLELDYEDIINKFYSGVAIVSR